MRLTLAAKEGRGFEHVTQRLRDAREDTAALSALAETLAAKGVRIVDRPSHDDKTTLDLNRLATKEGGRAYNKSTHAKCTGHAAYLHITTRWQKDAKGKEIRVRQAEPCYVCTDWRGAGHIDLWNYGRGSSTPKAVEMTPEARERARAERRDVIDSNKAWDTAEPVRRAWLATFAQRKTAPKGTATFIARVLTEHPEVVANVGGAQLATEWFGLKHNGYGYGSGWADLLDKATEARAQVIALCRLLASLEKSTSRESWRRVAPSTADYLTFIAANGYDLSDVEKRAAGLVKPKPARRTRANADPAATTPDTTQPDTTTDDDASTSAA